MVAVEVEKAYAEEAKQRQIRKPELVVAILPLQNKGEARDKAAEMLTRFAQVSLTPATLISTALDCTGIAVLRQKTHDRNSSLTLSKPVL